MSDEFIAALALTERVRDYEAAIRSFDQAIVNGDEIRRERDDALATISRVWAVVLQSNAGLVVDKVRKALEPPQSEAQQAASATNGRKGTGLRPCDSKPVAVESEPGTNREDTP